MPRATKLDAATPYPPGWEPFLAAINADLDDDTPRLVFADWLQENGDEPRAQFVRLQCAAARGGQESVAEADALLAKHQTRWMAGLPKWCREHPEYVGFRRGLVFHLAVRGRDWASSSTLERDWDANGRAIRRITALEDLVFDQVWNTVLESTALKGLRTLILQASGSALIEALARSPVLPSLTALEIVAMSSNGVSQKSFRAALGSKKLAGLRRLRIESVGVGNAIAECLQAPHFANVEELMLWYLGIDATGIQSLARSPALATLRVFQLHNNPVGDDGLAHLLGAPALRNLEELDLDRCGLTSASARALADWEGLRSVRKLDLSNNRLQSADADLILASPHAAALTRSSLIV